VEYANGTKEWYCHGKKQSTNAITEAEKDREN